GPGKWQIRSGSVFTLSTSDQIIQNGPVENSGTVNWLGGASSFFTNPAASWINLAGSTFDVQGDGQLGGTSTPFTNAPGSTFKRSAGNGTVNCIVQFNHNAGALPISTGKLQLFNGGTWSADATVTGDLIIAGGLLATQKVTADKLTVNG